MESTELHNHQVGATPEERMQKLVASISAYIEQYHGGWVRYVDFDGKVLKVEMGGACRSCSLSETTLHGWVKGTVRQFFPELISVENVG
ncbi:MAG: NifU family protein [Anaerolineales bacterium]|jgi:Fe-S cluster biogenesis protein NfuA|nr:NifU family protein [Anaerolineae bacterium]